MGEIEYGVCEICGERTQLTRTYFRYGFKCACHSPEHFELVRHCKNCTPTKPITTKVIFTEEQAELVKKAINSQTPGGAIVPAGNERLRG